MTDILDLPGWTVLSKRLDGDEYELEAEYGPQPEACLKCGVLGRLYKHGVKAVTYRDSPIRGHTVRILARVQRYRCRDCQETFLQPVGGMEGSRRMTARCAHYIRTESLKDTFVRVASRIGCDDWTVRSVAGEHTAELDAQYRPYLPVQLGMDETQIDGVMRCVITDVGARKPIEMLPERDYRTVSLWLSRFPAAERDAVQVVAIDMWRPYKKVSGVLLPKAVVVVDKFHIVRTANYCLERVRVRLGKSQQKGERRAWMRSKHLLDMRPSSLSEKQRFALEMWLDNEPIVAAAYQLKERFYGIYDMPKKEAIAAFDSYAASVPAHLKADFKTLLTSMKNWRTEILNYFDHPVTNAYTEALNGVAKTINRQGRGYSFPELRARLLFQNMEPTMKPLPEPTPVDLPRAPLPEYDGSTIKIEPVTTQGMRRLHALERAAGHCESCQGAFPDYMLQLHRVPPIAPEEKPKYLAVCPNCHSRFHTDHAKH